MKIGERLHKARTAAGMSQSELEKATKTKDKPGIKREYISKIENNELTNLTVSTISRLAYALNLSVVEILGGSSKDSNNSILELKYALYLSEQKRAKTNIILIKIKSQLDEIISDNSVPNFSSDINLKNQKPENENH